MIKAAHDRLHFRGWPADRCERSGLRQEEWAPGCSFRPVSFNGFL